MLHYVAYRMAVAALTLFAVVTIIFLILHMIPGDPAEVLASVGDTPPPPKVLDEIRRRLGLHLPIHIQYKEYLLGLMTGDLGVSFQDEAPVLETVLHRLPRTLELIAGAAFISVLIGLPAGILAAIYRNGWFDRIVGAYTGLALSVPVFVTGTLLVLVVSQTLHLVPTGNFVSFSQDPLQHLIILLMPSLTIALGLSAVLIRMMRSSVLEALNCDWVRTARAKGLREKQVLTRHVARNALSPVVTVFGLQLGALLGGTVLVEYVFNWPGLSGLLVNAVEQRDYPMVRGVVLVISAIFVLLNLCIDIVYAALDPRVKL